MFKLLRRGITGVDEYDGPLLLSVFALCLLGCVMVFGAASFRREAVADHWGHFYYLIKHLIRLVLGILVMVALAHLDYRLFRKRTVCWLLLAAGLALTFVPVALKLLGGAAGRAVIRRCVPILGLFPVQPLEFAKVAVVLFLAERLWRPQIARELDLRRLLLILVMPALLVLILIGQPNYGNALIISAITLLIVFLAGVPLRWLWLLLGPVIAGAGVGIVAVGKISTRVHQWWHGLHGEGLCYQVTQSLIGIGAGGWHGLGLGAGHQRFWFLPESHTDFIFAIIGEELGLVGTLATLLLFVILILRGLGIARRAPDAHGRLVAGGLTLLIFLYVSANAGMVLGLWPVMGVPLPFVSYGGSALVTNLGIIGILLSIDRHGRLHQQWQRRAEARLGAAG